MPRADDHTVQQFSLCTVRENIDKVHGELFQIVVNHHQVAVLPLQLLLVGFDLHLALYGLLLIHFVSLPERRFELTISPFGSHDRRPSPEAAPCLLASKTWSLHGVPLTSEPIKCSLALLFSIVNFRHGTNGPATTRNRPARLRRNSRRLLLPRGDAREGFPAVLAGISSQHPFFFRGFLVPQDPGLCRPGVSRGRRLHGPRQLGHGHWRRVKVRLYTSERHPH